MAAVFVLGHRGMLGRVVARHLAASGHEVRTSDARFSPDDAALISEVRASGADVVVNCAAVIGQKGERAAEMFAANALLPQLLAANLSASQLLIHASTDGVFSGVQGPYAAGATPDASDPYGMSKRLGELAMSAGAVVCIRSSIVDTTAGLLRWLSAQAGPVDGYDNQIWNGVTTLEWARACNEAIASGGASRIVHLTCRDPVSKYQLLRTAAEVFDLPVEIRPVLAPTGLNRALIPTDRRASIETLLRELKESRESAQ